MTSSPHYDAIVVGLGGMGSAALYHLARRNQKVLGLERFDIPNEMGSSHGITRIIRLDSYEDSDYVPLLRRAYELWRDLERSAGEQFHYITGAINAGPPDSEVFQGSLRSCRDHGLAHEVLDSVELRRRFPGYQLPSGTMAVFQPDGGFLLPERCIVAHTQLAQALGADVRAREQVVEWEPLGSGVRVRTDRGEYQAYHLLLTAGAWMGQLAPLLARLAIPERQCLAWFQPLRSELFAPDCFPVFNVLVEEGRYYGFPIFAVPGFKVGRYHHLGQRADPDRTPRTCDPEDEALLRSFTERYFPDAAGPTASLKFCMFTNSPDRHFILDLHPQAPQVVLAAGFSGHGFKFCSVIGEVLADLATTQMTRHHISFLRLARFALTPCGASMRLHKGRHER